jgi:hypothetical protein
MITHFKRLKTFPLLLRRSYCTLKMPGHNFKAAIFDMGGVLIPSPMEVWIGRILKKFWYPYDLGSSSKILNIVTKNLHFLHKIVTLWWFSA